MRRGRSASVVGTGDGSEPSERTMTNTSQPEERAGDYSYDIPAQNA